MSWKDGLDPTSAAFRLASSDEKVIRAVAGPGSGKSFAIKKRILRLLEDGIDPKDILAITFTRTAARDLKKEISSLGSNAELVQACTLHSHALKILLQADVLATTGRTPRIVLEHEIKPALKDLELSMPYSMAQLDNFNSAYLSGWATLQDQVPGYAKNAQEQEFESKLIDWLKTHKGLMIGEVIPVAMDFLRNNPAHPERSKFKVILVDEYQDLNKCEQEFVRLLSDKASMVIVGDDDQSIYGFKNAHPTGIQEIDKMYGDFDDVTFSECRRCPQQVTRMASALINKNTGRTLGDLIAHSNNPEGSVDIVQWETYDDEINGIAKIVIDELGKGLIKPADVLILTPRRLNGYQLRDKLSNSLIPVKSYFTEAAIKNDSVKSAYSTLNLLANPDDLISLRYLLGAGSGNYREPQYKKLQALSTIHNLSIREVLIKLSDGSLTESGLSPIVKQFNYLTADLDKLQEILSNDPFNLFDHFITSQSDAFAFAELLQIYLKALDDDGTEDYKDPYKLSMWFKSIFDQMQENLSTPDVPEDNDHVKIMSLHASKGLGAKLVILCSMVEGLLPRNDTTLSVPAQAAALEESRRLFYVAVTRCKASDDYEGRLVISSFLKINRINALRIGYGDPTKSNPVFNAITSTFVKDFGSTSPKPIAGRDL